jgi:hypothetical protein
VVQSDIEPFNSFPTRQFEKLNKGSAERCEGCSHFVQTKQGFGGSSSELDDG